MQAACDKSSKLAPHPELFARLTRLQKFRPVSIYISGNENAGFPARISILLPVTRIFEIPARYSLSLT